MNTKKAEAGRTDSIARGLSILFSRARTRLPRMSGAISISLLNIFLGGGLPLTNVRGRRT